jgi:hypothetical protein
MCTRTSTNYGCHARVKNVDAKENRITVERDNGERESYDPRRLSGVAVSFAPAPLRC